MMGSAETKSLAHRETLEGRCAWTAQHSELWVLSGDDMCIATLSASCQVKKKRQHSDSN